MDLEKQLKKNSVEGEIWVTEFTIEAALQFREEMLDVAKVDPTKPIIIHISSYGGSVDALASMIETVDEIPNPVVTVAHGMAMSCGAVLLSHGDVRFCGRHARVMVHEVSGGVQNGDVHDMYADATEVKRLNRWFMGLLAKNCGIKGGYDMIRKILKDQDGRDRYMDADAAVKFGIADVVGVPTVNSMKLYQVEVLPAKQRTAKKPNKKSETKQRQRRGSK